MPDSLAIIWRGEREVGRKGKERNMSTVVKTQKTVNKIIKRREEREGEDTAKEKK